MRFLQSGPRGLAGGTLWSAPLRRWWTAIYQACTNAAGPGYTTKCNARRRLYMGERIRGRRRGNPGSNARRGSCAVVNVKGARERAFPTREMVNRWASPDSA